MFLISGFYVNLDFLDGMQEIREALKIVRSTKIDSFLIFKIVFNVNGEK
jgi:hypothetical protein